jgi:chorismate synthase
MPAGVPVLAEQLDHQLARRQRGYGRGGRMKIETDRVDISSAYGTVKQWVRPSR